jgi:hypothetical protein
MTPMLNNVKETRCLGRDERVTQVIVSTLAIEMIDMQLAIKGKVTVVYIQPPNNTS